MFQRISSGPSAKGSELTAAVVKVVNNDVVIGLGGFPNWGPLLSDHRIYSGYVSGQPAYSISYQKGPLQAYQGPTMSV